VVGTVVSAMAVDVKALPAPARWRHFFYVTSALTATEFKLRYFGSVLGYLWTLLRPLMIFGVLYVVFTEIFRFGADVPHYAVMLLFGLMIWNFFADATGSSLPSLVQRESLLRKVAFPRAAIPIAVSMTAAANLILGLMVVFFFALLDGVAPRVSWLGIIPIVLGILVFAAGLALLLSALYVRFRDIQPIWEVASQILFWATPIIYTVEVVPDRMRTAIMFNPLSVAIQQARVWFVDPSAPTPAEAIGGGERLLIPLAIFVLTVLGGIWVFKRFEPGIAEEL
jgi:ABC-2 type transport system permease protein